MLYKYLPVQRIDVISGLKIRFSPLKSLNDPFESLPLIDVGDISRTTVKELIASLDAYWENLSEVEKTSDNKLFLEKSKKAAIEGAKSQLEPSKVGEGLMDILRDRIGVLSLSRTNSNLLMWSHYADSSTGYVIGLNEDHDFFRQKNHKGEIVRALPVTYTEKRNAVSYKHDNWYHKLLCTKPIDWAYEEEERIFLTHLNKVNAIGKDEYGMDIILSALPADAISAVYLGYKITKQTERLIIDAVKKNINCPIYKSSMSRSEYKIEFNKINYA